jgi:Concanavalin A-like lectin/glucanases superfamily
MRMKVNLPSIGRFDRTSIIVAGMGMAVLALTASIASASVSGRHYNFEQGTAGGTTTTAADVIPNLTIAGTGPRVGLLWVEVPGPSPRPLPGGPLQDAVAMSGLTTPELAASFGSATYANVANGSALDSPAVGSRLALRFDGTALFDDSVSAPGSRGVFVDAAAYANNDDVAGGGNTFENFSLITQAWVRPDAAGMGTYQTVYQAGGEQGSINITTDGFWEAANLGSVGLLTTTIPVAFDQWTHVGIFRGGNGAELYINGVLVAGNRNPDPPQFFGAFAGIIAVGGDELGSNGYRGLIDDFKVMGTADGAVNPRLDMDYWDRIISCDFNNDTACNVADLNLMLQQGPIGPGVAVTAGQNEIYDLNEDGTIDTADRNSWLAGAATQNGLGSPYKVGDANLDGVVDGSDFGIWNSNKFTTALNWDQGDFNHDGNVDGSDFGLWNGNKFTSSDGSVVPEPSSLLVALLATASLAARHLRKTNLS